MFSKDGKMISSRHSAVGLAEADISSINDTLKMESSNPTPNFFVKEIFLNIIIALRRLFIIFWLF